MLRYHIHLIYAVTFATTDAMQYTSSETNVHMNYSANCTQNRKLTQTITCRNQTPKRATKMQWKKGRSKHRKWNARN